MDQHSSTSENVYSSIQQKSSVLPQLPLAGVEPPSVQQKGPAEPLQLSINNEVTISPLDSGEAQHVVVLEREMEGCSFWRRQPLWLWDICWILKAALKRNVE